MKSTDCGDRDGVIPRSGRPAATGRAAGPPSARDPTGPDQTRNSVAARHPEGRRAATCGVGLVRPAANAASRVDRVGAQPPITTSARKDEWFSTKEFLTQLAVIFLIPWATRRRRLCAMWYKRPAAPSEPS